jgi:hypothetical protein
MIALLGTHKVPLVTDAMLCPEEGGVVWNTDELLAGPVSD